MNQIEQLKQIMYDDRITIPDICQRAGITRATYYNIIRKGNAHTGTMEKIAKALKYKIVWVKE